MTLFYEIPVLNGFYPPCLLSVGGMFALGAEGSTDHSKYVQLGADIANTCHESYDRSGKYNCHFKSLSIWLVPYRSGT